MKHTPEILKGWKEQLKYKTKIKTYIYQNDKVHEPGE